MASWVAAFPRSVHNINRQVLVAQRVRDLKQLGLQLVSADAIGLATHDGVKMIDRALVPPTAKPVHERGGAAA